MSDQPSQRPDTGQPDSSTPSGLEPPRFAPPYGSQSPSAPPYGQGSYGQGAYGEPGQYGGAYGQPPSPYNQQPSPYGQPAGPYAQQGYYGMQAEPKTLSIASMVCGIASVIMGWLLLPQIAAIITGHMALKREPSGRGMSIAGLVLGYLCLLGYGAFWLLAIIGLAIASSTSGSTYTF
ncbi:DUF4190 domain-containing protein [Pseudarthrobacter polychromogenes]|uniref:DUF4190 domain-containing protein n=1 Tax=Pseudarthrobacter polychromogenes TaxID=1676 RepID=A0ABQ1XHN0_9MICC|nr:DUF4190 domain-containing protein [Pseudarthrobacter polychromogenes]GGG93732.1 hypothetical protein GCM10011577_15750 [Pseudarthrobacter polychromogenes]